MELEQRRNSGINLPSGMSQSSLRLSTFRSTSKSTNETTPFRSNINLQSPRSVSSPRSITSLSSATCSPTSKKSICSDRFIPCRSSSRLHAFGLIEKPSPTKNSKEGGNNNTNNNTNHEAYTRLLKQELFGADFASPCSAAGSPMSSPNKNILRFKMEYSSPSSAFSPSGLSRDSGVSSDVSTPPKPPRKVPKTPHKVCGLKWSHDDRELASGGNDNQLLVWNQHSQQPVLKLTEHTAAVKAITWSPHQSGLLASGGGTADRCIRFWNTTNGNQINSIDTGSQVCNLAWSKNVNELVSTHGYSQNQIMVWKYPSLSKVATLTGHSLRVLYLSVSPDGQTIVTGAGDETLRFWNVFPSVKTPAPVKETGLWSLGRTYIR